MAFVDLEQRGSIGILTMNRPEALNALNDQVLRDLDAALDAVEANDEILVVILTGAGRSFVAGADIGQMKDFTSVQAKKFGAYGNSVFLKLENFPKPVIAAVNGFALGGGCELALSCDIRIASEKAVFGQPEVTLGIIPCFGGTQRLPRLIGTGLAKEMIYTGKHIDAQTALRYGLVNRVVPAEALLDEAKALMDDILKVSPMAIKYAKLSINKGADMDLMNALEVEKDLVGLCFATEDKQVGMQAFLEKRKPNFR